jgi:IS5 family transposase
MHGGTIIDAMIIEAPTSTARKAVIPNDFVLVKQTKKGNECHFGLKAHIGVKRA